MTLPNRIPALRRLALVATVLGLGACAADDSEDTVGNTDDPTATATATATMTATATTDPSGSETTPGDTSTGDTAPVDVDYATDIQPIWTASCTAGCHEPGGIYAGLDLTAAASYAALTAQKPVYSTDALFVVADDSAGSFLIDAFRVPGGTIVRRMPLALGENDMGNPIGEAGTPLPEAQIMLVEQWIDAGANP